MYFLLSFLLASPCTTVVATRPRLATTPPNADAIPQYQSLLQRPISFSPPSQTPIWTSPPTHDGEPRIRGSVDISFYGLHEAVPVSFSVSPQVCMPLIHEVPYIIADLSQRMLSEHLDKVSFPFSPEPQAPPLPIYLMANITEQMYRSKFMLSLSLKLSPLEPGLTEIDPPGWRAIVGLLEQSAQELDRGRKKDGTGLGSVLVLEAGMDELHVLAEWRFWRIVDGVAVMCED